jgi:hypothetical protein
MEFVRATSSYIRSDIVARILSAFSMKLSSLLPGPIRQFVRKRMTVFVYTYGFRPSRSIAEQIITFSAGGRALSAKANYRTALYYYCVISDGSRRMGSRQAA